MIVGDHVVADGVPYMKQNMERETGLEPATFSLEDLDLYAVWRPSWKGVHFVSSYRVVLRT